MTQYNVLWRESAKKLFFFCLSSSKSPSFRKEDFNDFMVDFAHGLASATMCKT